MKKNHHTLSTKIKYLSLGIFVYLSIISIFATPSIGSDGKIGDYFVRITGICLPGEIITGYENGVSDYGTKKCTSLKTLFGNIFGSSTPPIDSSLIGFDFPSGNLVYKDNIWKTNVNGISYTGSQVGIGTNIPGAKFDIVGGDINVNPIGGGNIILGANSAGTVRISDMNASYFNGGFVGIGTSTPTTQLEVVGNIKVSTELRTQYIMLGGQPLKIPVVCTGQGKGLHWDGSNWSCIAMPIEGACNNAVANTCTYGTPSGYNPGSCGGNATWTCNGLNGGGSDTSCSKANPPCPVNGVCNNSTQYSCSVGTSINNNAGSCGGNTTWSCQGSNGGTDASCSKANGACAVNGVCGGSDWSCISGTPANGNAGSCGGSKTWTCDGINGGTQASCSNPNAACACIPNGSCSASAPACGTTTYGVDNCGNSCSRVGGACATTGVWSMVNAGCGGEQLGDNPILIGCNASSGCDIASVFGGGSCSNKGSFAFTVSYMGACPASFACQ